ncbi:TrkA-C domain protein [compost metagenome]
MQELPLGEVRVKAVHRGEQSLEARPELRLAAGDRLVLFGNAVAMEQAEQRLLEGY